jgi:hypothetical protein
MVKFSQNQHQLHLRRLKVHLVLLPESERYFQKCKPLHRNALVHHRPLLREMITIFSIAIFVINWGVWCAATNVLMSIIRSASPKEILLGLVSTTMKIPGFAPRVIRKELTKTNLVSFVLSLFPSLETNSCIPVLDAGDGYTTRAFKITPRTTRLVQHHH